VSHCCGALRRARAAQAAARARAACVERALGGRHCACPCSLHRQRSAPISGSSCSPDFSGAFSGTGGARACAPRPWGMLECGGAAVPFSRTSAAAAGGTAQLRCREKSPIFSDFLGLVKRSSMLMRYPGRQKGLRVGFWKWLMGGLQKLMTFLGGSAKVENRFG
jgi:hypothetical protein